MSREVVQGLSLNSVLIKDDTMKCPKCGDQLYHPSFQEGINKKGHILENWICNTRCGFDGMWNLMTKKWWKAWEKRKKNENISS